MTRKWLVHAIMECQACDWECQDYLVAQDEAREHHKKTGHDVHGELGYAVRYEKDGE